MSDQSIQINNPMLCDVESGICSIPESNSGINENRLAAEQKPIKIIYFTDPICSSCWGIEPQLRKLKLAYGHIFDIDYKMGGLLPDWTYQSGQINKASDVAHHWDEVSVYYDMPIDGNIWLEDPLHSSYPPSIALIAAAFQSKEKAVAMLRELREMVFLKKKNITKWENLREAAIKSMLDIDQLKTDYEGSAILRFKEDLAYANSLGVRGFPTFIFANTDGVQEKLYGAKPFEDFENIILKLAPMAQERSYKTDWNSLFTIYPTLSSREFAELSNLKRSESDNLLQALFEQGRIGKYEIENGKIWNSI
jgi:predicted DsbA family dithiol-disulfide isomerase